MPAHQARPVVTETDLELPGGRTLHVYDTAGDGGEDRLTVFWHHGTPNLGPPPEPLFRPPTGSASAGCRTTGPGTAGRPRARAGTWSWLAAWPSGR